MSTPLFTRFPLRSLALATVMLACSINAQAVETPKPHPWRDARQLVLVVTEGWDATTGTLQRFEMRDGHWQAASTAAPAPTPRNSTRGITTRMFSRADAVLLAPWAASWDSAMDTIGVARARAAAVFRSRAFFTGRFPLQRS